MLIAILVIAGIGFVGALALALADRFLAVREDPRIGLVSAALPGANCGGCGFPGCDGYARALVAGKAANGACTVGGAAVAAEIGRILGIDAGSVSRRVAPGTWCGSATITDSATADWPRPRREVTRAAVTAASDTAPARTSVPSTRSR